MDEIGGCRLTAVAGSGGFAVTYVGEHPDAGTVAVKVLSANWANDINVAARFDAECDKLAAAPSLIGDARYAVPRHVAHGIDHSPAGDRPYLVTELCGGGSLAQRLPLLRDLPLAERIGHAAWVVGEAAVAMAIVHDRLGVVHRDLSPGNLLFRRHPEGAATHAEELVIADFGLMKEAALQSNFSRVLGTAAYAAPEVRTHGLCDHRSDVYSLGVIAWELMTGRTPEPEQSYDLDPGVPADLAALVTAMTARQREDRPDLPHVVATLAPHATTPPAAPPDEELTTPLRAGPRRRRRLLAAAGAGLATLLAAGGLLAWQLAPGGDRLTSYTPVNGGFTIDLDDSEWSQVDTDPDVPGVLLSGLNPTRGLVFTVAATGAATLADAVTFASEVVAAGQDGGEVISSEALADDRAKLVYQAGGFSFVTYFAARSCGTLTLQFNLAGELDDETLAYLDEVAATFELADEITVQDADGELPPGRVWFEGSGVRLAAPDTFIRNSSGSNCVQISETTPGRNMSVSVTYAPAVTAAEKAAADDAALRASGYELIEGSPTPDGTQRGHWRSAELRVESAYYYVPASSGVFVVLALEGAGEPWDQAWLDLLDEIATSLEVTGTA